MANLKHRRVQGFFNRYNSVNREVVSATHPFTDLSFALAQQYSKVFLTKATCNQNFMNPVNDLERESYPFSRFGINVFATLFQNSTPFHLY